jgi:hypothetical protein
MRGMKEEIAGKYNPLSGGLLLRVPLLGPPAGSLFSLLLPTYSLLIPIT